MVIDYISNVFIKGDDFLNSVYLSASENVRVMQISPVEVQIISVLIKMARVNKILEIGTCVGYSAICMANMLSYDGLVITVEKNKEFFDIANNNCALFKTYRNNKGAVHLINGDAIDVIPQLGSYAPFDMIFIDAQKSFYLDYLLLAENLLKEGSIVVADNTLLFNSVLDEHCDKVSCKKMREFNQYLAQNVCYNSIMIPTVEGMTIAVKVK